METQNADNAGPITPASAVEIERKFHVRELPGLDGVTHEEIRQGYLAVDADGTEVRLRCKGSRCFVTVKSGSGLRRGEYETEIDARQFETLWPATEGKRVDKTRYEVPYKGLIIELDIYQAALAGLHVAEVEFESEAQSDAFEPPPWFGSEITFDGAYKNRSLAVHGRPPGS